MLLKIPQEEAALSWELSVTKMQCNGIGVEWDQDFSSLEAALSAFGQMIPSLCGSYPTVIWTEFWYSDRVFPLLFFQGKYPTQFSDYFNIAERKHPE